MTRKQNFSSAETIYDASGSCSNWKRRVSKWGLKNLYTAA